MTEHDPNHSPRPGYAEASRSEDEELALDVSLDDLDATGSRRPLDPDSSGAQPTSSERDAFQPPSWEPPPSSSLPLARLVALLPDDGEVDARWGARRRGERIPFSKPVTLSKLEAVSSVGAVDLKVEAVFDGWSINVCHGGMRILTEEELRADDVILVEVESSGSVYLGRARVCWVRAEPGGVIAGVEFLASR